MHIEIESSIKPAMELLIEKTCTYFVIQFASQPSFDIAFLVRSVVNIPNILIFPNSDHDSHKFNFFSSFLIQFVQVRTYMIIIECNIIS